ncbi:MAG: phosphate acetyltransferase, partial [Bacteroidetes bacterium]|nr:phosphate acetyltransferase [Bacteroidota bacterium]
MELIEKIKESARKKRMRIVLPEGLEPRTLEAADKAISEGLASIILIGNPDSIMAEASARGYGNIAKAIIVDPLNHPMKNKYIDLMVELRKAKGLTREEASRLIEDPLYLGVMMIKAGDADGEVAGADNATGDVLRPAFQFVRTAPGISVVSGAFIMILNDKEFGDDGIIMFADGAVHPDPNEKELAEIAVATANTYKSIIGGEPRVAML